MAVWPGSARNTRDITRFIALESRSYVVSVSGLMRREDIGAGPEWREMVASASADILADGGSCVAGPDGVWVIPPAPPLETLLVATIDHKRVREERQNFDPSGHYARPEYSSIFRWSFPASPPASNCGLRRSFYPGCPRAARSVSFRMNLYLSN